MKVLIVDDACERHTGLGVEYSDHLLDHAYTYQEAIDLLRSNLYDLVCLDHDLGDFRNGVERTGYSVALFMAEFQIKTGEIRVHSHNPVGAKAIMDLSRRHGLASRIYYEPFAISPGANMIGLKQIHLDIDLP
jgi:hypothetical protein